jgi:ribonuclease HI
MELIACVEGVKATAALGISNVILETDAQQAVWAIQGDDFRLAVVGGLVHDLKDLIAESFTTFSTNYVPHDCNKIAHKLASSGSRSHDLAPFVLAGVPKCILFASDLGDMVE